MHEETVEVDFPSEIYDSLKKTNKKTPLTPVLIFSYTFGIILGIALGPKAMKYIFFFFFHKKKRTKKLKINSKKKKK